MTNNPDTEGNESQMIKAGENQNNSILDIDNLSDAEKAIAKAAREEMNKIRARRQETAKQQYLQAAKELKEKEEALKKASQAGQTKDPTVVNQGVRLNVDGANCGIVLYDDESGYQYSVLPENAKNTDAIFSTIEDKFITNQAWVADDCPEADMSGVYGTQARGPNIKNFGKGKRSFNYDIQLCDAENNKFNCANLLPGGDPNSELCETSKEGNNLITVGDRIVPQSSTQNGMVSLKNGASVRPVPGIGSAGQATTSISKFFGVDPKDAGRSAEQYSQQLLSEANANKSGDMNSNPLDWLEGNSSNTTNV